MADASDDDYLEDDFEAEEDLTVTAAPVASQPAQRKPVVGGKPRERSQAVRQREVETDISKEAYECP